MNRNYRRDPEILSAMARELALVASGEVESFSASVPDSDRYVQATMDPRGCLLVEASSARFAELDPPSRAEEESLALAGMSPPCDGKPNHYAVLRPDGLDEAAEILADAAACLFRSPDPGSVVFEREVRKGGGAD